MDRGPAFGIVTWRTEPRRHDADDGIDVIAQRNRLADDRLIAAELSLPQLLTQNHDERPSGLVIVRAYDPATFRLHAQGLEITTGDLANLKLHRFCSGCVIEWGENFTSELAESVTGRYDVR